MFSATGNILSGSADRPDMYTIATKKLTSQSTSLVFISENSNRLGSTLCTFNKLGYIPGISTVTGCGRALLGIVHSIVHLASAVFDSKNRAKHLEEAKLGGKNIARGLIEMIPVIGNITMCVVDWRRTIKFEKQAEEVMKQNPGKYNHHTMLFIYGKEIAKRPNAEVDKQLAKIKKPSEFDLINIIKNKA